jgi:uncharacterized membrane protein
VWTELRKTLLAGLLVLAPITLTIYILYHLFRLMDGILRDTVITFLVEDLGWSFIKTPIPGLGIVALLAVLIIVGAIARNYLGRKLFAVGDYIVTHIPLINRIYTAIVEISEAILSERREIFKKAVLIEYPREGLYSVAFFTQDTKGPVQDKLDEDVVSVFLPTTPNPTSGYLLFVPKKDTVDLDMSVEDALKLVISGGSIHLKEQKGFDSLFSLGAAKKRRKRSKRISSSGTVEAP